MLPGVARNIDTETIAGQPASDDISDDGLGTGPSEIGTYDSHGGTVIEEAIGQAGPPGVGSALDPTPTPLEFRNRVPSLRLKIAIGLIAAVAVVLSATL